MMCRNLYAPEHMQPRCFKTTVLHAHLVHCNIQPKILLFCCSWPV